MMNRRNFLKNVALGVSASLLPGGVRSFKKVDDLIPLGRVTIASLSVYSQPSEFSRIKFQRFFNDLLHIYEIVESPDGPGYNPIWYRVWGGYVHSGYVQGVKNHLNPIIQEFPSVGSLMEVTVPFSTSYRIRSGGNWEPFYTLFYGSTHRVHEITEGPLGKLYYRINDSLLTTSYYVLAEHLRMVYDDELTPINSDVLPKDKSIEISIDHQSLRALEYGQVVKDFYVSTGRVSRSLNPDIIPTETPKGDHIVRSKKPSVHMGDGSLRSDASDEYKTLPGVPWVSYFEPQTGVAIHGTYWHNNYGTVMSAGCINMLPEDAKWIYRWSTPYPDASITDLHTPVFVY
jgi:hypothetical protein